MKDRRSKLQLYFDICAAIIEDSQNNEKTSNTRIQFKSNTSYDKLLKYLSEMDQKGMIKREKSLVLTEVGMQFYNDYSNVSNLIDEITERLS
jgi:predicted transcriptional regulator